MKRTFGLLGAIVVMAIVADVVWTRMRPTATTSATTATATMTPTPTPTTTPTPSTAGKRADGRGHVVLTASWGAGDGQLGRRGDPESVAEGPMSLIADGRGVVVLDNVNRRLVRFDGHGKPLATIALPSDAVQDLARGRRDQVATLDRLRDKRVTLYDADGRVGATTPVPDGATVTGLFGDRNGELWLEREHKSWAPLAADATPRSAPGRPTRDGRFVAGAIGDRAAGRAQVKLFGGDGTPAWEATVDFGAPLMFLALLDGDAAGNIYVGAHTGHESATPPYSIDDEALTLVALTASGSERARLTVPAPPPREESFRDLYVGDDGTIYWMRRTSAGVVVEAYRL